MPAYCPELNAIELMFNIWKMLKKNIYNNRD